MAKWLQNEDGEKQKTMKNKMFMLLVAIWMFAKLEMINFITFINK